MSANRPSSRPLLVTALAALALLGRPAAGPAPRAATAAPAAAPGEMLWHARSPYKSLDKNRQFLNTIGLRALTGYQPGGDGDRRWLTSGRPGIEARSLYARTLAGGRTRTAELAISPSPDGGYDLYLFGSESGPGGETANPDLPTIRQSIEQAIEDARKEELERLNAPLDPRNLAFEPIKLSYVHADQALGLLKALGYTVVEYSGLPGENLYQKIYAPNQTGNFRLPLVLKMVDSPKTSLQEPPPPEVQMPAGSAGVGGMASNLLPDLGGLFLHHDTSGDPQQRLLIAYDPDDVPSLERLSNFIREKIDVPAQQIVIEALVVEIRGDATRDLGVEWVTNAVTGLSPYRDTVDLTLGVDKAPKTPDPLTFVFSRFGAGDLLRFKATLQALLETSKAQILSSPSLLVLDGRQARIQIGDQIPVPSTTIFGTSGQTESVSYFPVGIVLNLRPRISDDGSEVSMQIETIVSSVRSVSDVTAEITAPTVASRQVQTMVRVANDTPFIIGGLTAHTDVDTTTGVPGLAEIPWLGALFRRNVKTKTKNEVIIVVTPHIVPREVKNFSYVIPQESPIFDSFGHQLFYNAFRIRHQDVFDLDFVFESRAYRQLKACAERWTAQSPAAASGNPEVARLRNGGVPGEDVLVRRMLFETIRKTEYIKYVDPARIIFFEDDPTEIAGSGFKLSFLQPLLLDPRARTSALALTFDMTSEGTAEHPFVQPKATVNYLQLPSGGYDPELAQSNRRRPDGRPEQWTILIGDDPTERILPIDLLKGVIVLKRLLDLNPDLPLTIREFRAGRQIVFPTESDLRDSYHLLDPDAARMFYELHSYYQAFEDEFKHSAAELLAAMGPCPEWTLARQAHLDPPPANPGPRATPAVAAERSSPTAVAPDPAPATPPARAAVSAPAPPAAAVEPPAQAPVRAAATASPAPTANLPRAVRDELASARLTAQSGGPAETAARAPLYASAERAFSAGDPATGHLWLGRLYLSAGMKHAAVKSLRDAAALAPASAEIQDALAQAYEQMGKPGDATRARQRLAAAPAPASHSVAPREPAPATPAVEPEPDVAATDPSPEPPPAPEVPVARAVEPEPAEPTTRAAEPAEPGPGPVAPAPAQAPRPVAATQDPTEQPPVATNQPSAAPDSADTGRADQPSSAPIDLARLAPLTAVEIDRAREAVRVASDTDRPKLDRLYQDCLRAFETGDPARGYLLLGDLYSAAGSHRAALSALYAALRLASSSQIEEALARVYDQLGNADKSAEHAARARAGD